MKKPTNIEIADLLDRIADVLEVDDANPFRVRAYREGAGSVRYATEKVADLIGKHKLDEVKAIPGIGEGIAAVIREYVTTGQSNLLQELEAKAGPEAVLVQVPGIGKELAERIVDKIHVETLPELEVAAHDGRLEQVPGFGRRRVAGIQSALAGMLSQSARTRQQARTNQAGKDQDDDEEADRPSVELLLEIDSDYRQKAAAGELTKIAPRRFNPDNEAWLPVLHTQRDGWTFTALFSNTARAHELEKTDDWVVIYYERDDQERQNTVVTETHGVLEGKRVVRGRNAENRKYYNVEED